MNSKIVNHKKDDAVSPVVGVMLMLVVTIVIAAVVALFATSVVTDTNAAPVAVIQMDAYDGEPLVNDKLVMSIIGGKALELSKLKCVVTVEDGKYGIVFKSLDTDPVVGKFLEIGEQLEIFNFDTDNDGMRKINSLIGGTYPGEIGIITKKIQDSWAVGNKVNVMIVFDENAILYKRDIIIQDGIHQAEGAAVTIDSSTDNEAVWTGTSSTFNLEWTNSAISVSALKSDGSVDVTIEENTASNESTAITLNAAPMTSGNVITKILVGNAEVTPGNSTTINGNFTLTGKQGPAPASKCLITLTATNYQGGSTTSTFEKYGETGVTSFEVDKGTVLKLDKATKSTSPVNVISDDGSVTYAVATPVETGATVWSIKVGDTDITTTDPYTVNGNITIDAKFRLGE